MKPQKHKLLLTDMIVNSVNTSIMSKYGPEFLSKNSMYYYKILNLVWVLSDRKDQHDFTKIHSRDFREVAWARRGTRQISDIVKHDLIEFGILECDNSWWHGNGPTKTRSLGYKFSERFVPKIDDIRVLEYEEPPKILQAHGRDRLHIKSLRDLKVDFNAVTIYLKTGTRDRIRIKDDEFGKRRYLTKDVAAFWYLQAFNIAHGKFWFMRNDLVGRVFTNVTNFPSMMRQFLYFKSPGDSVTIDVVNSQPLLINAVMKLDGVVDEEYKRDCETGRFYEVMASALPDRGRDWVKTTVFKEILYGGFNSQSKLVKLFKSKYPTAYDYIRKEKEKDTSVFVVNQYSDEGYYVDKPGNAVFAIKMQNIEADIVLGALFEIHSKGVTAVGIHDAIFAPKEYRSLVQDIMAKHFHRYDIAPSFK